MNTLRVDSAISNSNPNIDKLQQKANNLGETVKTPRRGLGLLVNGSSTPGARSNQFSEKKSNRKLKKSVPDFSVFEDNDDEPREVINIRELVKSSPTISKENPSKSTSLKSRPTSPIERASRCSLGHDSIEEFLSGQNNEIVDLADDGTDVFADDYKPPVDLESKRALDDMNVERWSEYPPIEIASRIELEDSSLISYNDDDYEELVDSPTNIFDGLDYSNDDIGLNIDDLLDSIDIPELGC